MGVYTRAQVPLETIVDDQTKSSKVMRISDIVLEVLTQFGNDMFDHPDWSARIVARIAFLSFISLLLWPFFLFFMLILFWCLALLTLVSALS